jgi:XTP/dITP diphosphohydrolase
MAFSRVPPMIDALVVATGNAGKLIEIRDLLSGLDMRLLSLRDFSDLAPAEEDEPTLEGNAVKKARTVFEATAIPVIADDTGLEVDALHGAPGVFSARFAGPDCDPAANREKLLALLREETNRAARFRTVVALVASFGTITFTGVCEGRIARSERGTHGFGYDALFIPSGFDRTFAEMDSVEKNEISHRGQALRKVRSYLETLSARTRL